MLLCQILILFWAFLNVFSPVFSSTTTEIDGEEMGNLFEGDMALTQRQTMIINAAVIPLPKHHKKNINE